MTNGFFHAYRLGKARTRFWRKIEHWLYVLFLLHHTNCWVLLICIYQLFA